MATYSIEELRKKMGITPAEQSTPTPSSSAPQTSAPASSAQSGGGSDPVADTRKKIGIYTPRSDEEANDLLYQLAQQSAGIADFLNTDGPVGWEERSRYQDQITGARNQLRTLASIYGNEPLADLQSWYDEANHAISRASPQQRQTAQEQPTPRETTASTYSSYLSRPDFAELSQTGESKIRLLGGDQRYDYINNINGFQINQNASMRAGDWYKYTYMTDEERGIYNYIYATEGKKAANRYLSEIDRYLTEDRYTEMSGIYEDMIDNSGAGGRALASALTIAAQPVRTVSSLLALGQDAYRAATGQEIDPHSTFRTGSLLTQQIRGQIAGDIQENNPGFGGRAGSFVYQTAMSAGDSAMNMVFGRALAAGLNLGTTAEMMKATNIIGSALMSSEVASTSIADGKQRGYSDAGALTLGLVRGAVEYASEAIGGEWVIKNIKANPLSFVRSMLLNMIPEGAEEVMSDTMNGVINLGVDRLFGTQESGIPAMLQHFREEGTDWQKAHPELATVMAILGDEALSFLGGALATIGSSGVQTYNIRTGINETAQRLNTTPQGVVQLMEEMNTEDPSAIYALAEVYDAKDEAELRERIGETKDAEAALEEAMKERTAQTGEAYLQQVISNMDVTEAQAQILQSGLKTGDADVQTYAHGIQEAFRLGEMGLSYEQALDNAKLSEQLNETQFRHAWQIGAQKAGNSTEAQPVTRRAVAAPEYENIEAFSREFSTPERVTEIYDQTPDADVNEFAAGFRAAYDMGQSGLSAKYLTEANVPTLSAEQAQAAYQMGQTDAEAKAVDRDTTTAQQQKTGTLARVKGTVKGEGVTIADLRKAFNDRQNTAYRLLTRYAETTGVNIVLYNSQADSKTSLYPAAQGRFQWKDDTIYIDINSGLNKISDANELGNYTMLRTFAHEFTHFIEKWNAAEYNEFRQFVFDTLEARGENVHDLIEAKQAQDESGNMSYEQASREVIADAMMDILPDSTLVQQLAAEHQNVFKKLYQKLRELAARMKQYYREISSKAPREAEALKENNAYMDGIVQMWDRIAKGAVQNYQGANGEILVDQPAKPDNLPKKRAQQQRNNAQIREENAQIETKTPAPAAVMPKEAEIVTDNNVGNTEEATQEAQETQAAPAEPETTAAQEVPAPAAENTITEEAATNESTEIPAAEAPAVPAEGDAERDGNGAVRVPAEQPAADVQRNAAGREPASVPAEEGRGAGRDGDRPHAERNGRGRSERSGKGRVQSGRESGLKEIVVDLTPKAQEAAAPMSEEEHARQTEEFHETAAEQVEQKSTEEAGGSNFVIGESLDLPNGSKARFRANVDAIRLVKQLEAEGRNATAEEQAVLSRYVGWGGISEAFDERKGDWGKEYAELKELLTDEEYKAAKGSTLNAHYTSVPVIRAMYRGLERLGFKGGRMLEPSSGVGNFVGAMPADMTGTVKSWTMVELDNITGQIAKYLYPHNDVRIEGFEKTILPDNYMDVAIGNVPFGNYPVVDRSYPKKLTSAIHNYFFAKSLDKVRPGGIVMFITSSYTMNSNDQTIRKYISKQADLLGAIRLPNTAFSGNAGTQVVTDILVLKKRAPGTEYSGVPFVETTYDYKLGYQNQYFREHPEMVLGEEVTSRGMYRNNEYTVNPYTDRGSLEEQIGKAFEGIEVVGSMEYPAQESPEKTNFKVERAEKRGKQGSYTSQNGKIYQQDGGRFVEVQTDEKTAKRITGMLGIRDFAAQLMNAQQQGASEKSVSTLRRSLNKAYDSFVKEYGYLNSQANRKAFQGDPDRFSLFALENWDSEKKTATKADIFTVDTIRPNRTVTHADTVKDGLVVSRNTTGGVDVALISRLTGRSAEDVTRELIDSELAFKTTDGRLEPAETYLSGNVRAKLRDAQGLVGNDKDYQHNVDALKAIVPADIPHEQIFVQPGTPWIPESVYSDFAAYMLVGNNHRYYGGPDVAVHRSNQTGMFTIDLNNKRLKSSYQNTQEWGTPKRSFLNLLEAAMNSRSVTVTYKDSEGHTIVDRVATDAANEKIEQITKKFQEWMWADEERVKDLEFLYNEAYNNLVTPAYDGSTLTVNGLRAGWSLKPHQANAVQRVVSSGGNTLLAHRVGAGKTMEMAAAAMKLKELGIVKKPMFAVPKSLVAQWGKEFTSYFPAAKLLVAEQGDFTPANRKTFANRIATGNYDAIIVSYEQFEKIPISDEFAMSLYQEQIDEIIQAINEAKEENGQKSMSVKDMEKKRKQLEAKIEKLADKAKDADSIEFEQLGIDSLFVDEAHNFKNRAKRCA